MGVYSYGRTQYIVMALQSYDMSTTDMSAEVRLWPYILMTFEQLWPYNSYDMSTTDVSVDVRLRPYIVMVVYSDDLLIVMAL